MNKEEFIEEVQEEVEEEPFEIPTVEEVKKEKKDDPFLNSNSKYFINLDEKEINAKDTNTDSQDILTEKPKASTSENKVVKVKKRTGPYKLPRPLEKYLESSNNKSSNVNKSSAKVKGERVIEILDNFDIKATLLKTYIGPSVTKFEIKPDTSVKVNRIQNISDNLKMELAAKDIRIEAPIPGRSAVGIEIPNVEPIPVKMIDLMKNVPSDRTNEALLFALGKNLMGEGVYCNLAKMPHLLIAGATGSGKSVCINTIITSFLLRSHPDDVKLVLVDPKRVEFTPYHDIPHLLWPVITDATMASNMLKKIVVIMQERYEAFAEVGVRDINSFNNFVEKHNASKTSEESEMQRLPFIVIIIDELADLMAIAKKDVELSIQRITQLARASGIHLIIATQRPSTDVITGLIKSNVPSRISFAVASSIDSRTILDSTGAERLLGNGDMLYYPQGETAPIRMQGVFVTDNEIKNITDYVKSQAQPEYEDSYFEFLTNMNGTTVAKANDADSNDSLYDEVVEFVKMKQAASTSLLQRRFGIGYNRAARLIDTLEDRGIIGPAQGSKPREVYIKNDDE
ncbi:MAG: DNA translocase FtsK [Firmicutes bacterium]|nr:DNA translocase FtsK [Candidatus Colivicinus equi]